MSLWDRAGGFWQEVRVEIRKVTWPTLPELREATIVVIVTVLIISVFIAAVDVIVGQLVGAALTLG